MTPLVFADKGALVARTAAQIDRDLPVDIITVAAGARAPQLVGKILFAEEGSILSEIPPWMTLVEVTKGSAYPIVIGDGDQ